MSNVRYPEVTVQLTGEDGNAFFIMARVQKALREHGVSSIEIQEYRKASMEGDYDNLLRVAMEWVNTK